MNTDDLIQTLSRDVPRVSHRVLARRLAIGMVGGGIITMILVTAILGIRPDLRVAMHGFSFWMKWTYTLSLGVGAIFAVSRLARPTPVSLRWLWLLAVPVLLLAGIGIGELVDTPSRDWLAMWLGGSWKVCPWLVLTLAMPIFVGLLWSFRRMAPTRLRAAGAAAGLAAGAWAATIYCLHCPEVSAIFVLTWYSLGIVLAAAVGALIGPKLMRW
ncbi:MAG: DUF1109 domain-containing protein [Sphingomonas oligoaromativorans]|jgi:hypothetical protein|uniref:DUF1109 domain-containing protein n=1 Tax=Sphingomonas oligoaromativorans TaxID=575322 RepID=UPI001421F8CF|nr:DUF1109 domain-containing protein [Sphingomonas oligoaromativorans]NIJ32499.1 hypothetical protein [Sphingomonas oligoaromativorans]